MVVNSKVFFFVLYISFFFTSNSQTIKGKVLNVEGSPIVDANVIFKNPKTNLIIDYCRTDELGFFSKKLSAKKYILIISSLGYKQKTILIDSEKKWLKIELENNVEILTPVTIKAKRRSDIVSFEVEKIKKGDEQVVEDILQNIHGITVSDSGKITVGNTEIKKIMIENDDFFDKGYRMISKNMPSRAIYKIEILYNYNDNKMLRGLKDSDDVAINLKLDSASKNVWFGDGKFISGIVTENQFLAGLNLMNFGKRTKIYFFGHYNNIGQNPIGDIKDMIEPFNLNESVVGDNQHAYTFFSPPSINTHFEDYRVNFNNQKIISPNIIFNISNKVKAKFTSIFNDDNLFFTKKEISKYYLQDKFLVFDKIQKNNEKLSDVYNKFDLYFNISNSFNIQTIAKYNNSVDNNFNDEILNKFQRNEILNADNESYGVKNIFSYKKNNKAFLLTTNVVKENKKQHRNIKNSKNNIENSMLFSGLELYSLIKHHKILFENKVGFQYRNDKLMYNDGVLFNSDILSKNLYLKSMISYKKKKSRYSFSIDFHKYNFILQGKKGKTNILNTAITYDYKVNKNHFNLDFSYKNIPVETKNLIPFYIRVTPQNMMKGYDDFSVIRQFATSFSYNYGGLSDFNGGLGIDYKLDLDALSYSFKFNKNVLYQDCFFIKNQKNHFVDVYVKNNFYLNSIKSNFKLVNSLQFSNNRNLINKDIINSSMVSFNNKIELKSGFDGFFNYHLGVTRFSSFVKSDTDINKMVSYQSFFDIKMNFKKIRFVSKYEMYHINKKKYNFVDLKLSYSNFSLDFTLQAVNLFDINVFKDLNYDYLLSNHVEYKIRPQSFLLGLKYKI